MHAQTPVKSLGAVTIRRADLSDQEVGFEACDDGNDLATDGCLPSCEAPRCGDGHVEMISAQAPPSCAAMSNPAKAAGVPDRAMSPAGL